MKFLSHSNGLHTVEKEKVNKINVAKRIVLGILLVFLAGFLVQFISQTVDNTRLKSRFKYGTIDGNKMEFCLKGNGKYTLIFDGSIGTNLYQWNEVCEELEGDSNISTFVYNRSGYGFNDANKNLTIEEQAKALKTLLRKAGATEPYILVGEEYGSLVLSNFAKLYPDSVAGVVFIDPIQESVINTAEFKESIKGKYYRSKLEEIGSSFSLTSILDKLGLAMDNKNFSSKLTNEELEEFDNFKNKKSYRKAVSNEIKNLYTGSSESQVDNLLNDKPLYIISEDENNSLSKLSTEKHTTIYLKEGDDTPYSMVKPKNVVTGINNVIKQAEKKAKKQ